MTQSNPNNPTVQQMKSELANRLQGLKDNLTQEMIANAAFAAGMCVRTAKKYLNKGEVAFVHKGELLFKTLNLEISKKKVKSGIAA